MNLLMKMPEADVRFMALPASLFAENSCVYTIISLFLFMPEWCSIVCWRFVIEDFGFCCIVLALVKFKQLLNKTKE